MTDLIGFINLFSGVIQIVMGFLVLISDLKSRVKRYYFFSVFFLGVWSLCIFFYSNPIILNTTIWLKLVYTAAYCMTLGLILFARVYPKELQKKFKVFSIIMGIYMFLMGILLWTTDLVVFSTYNIPNEFNTVARMGPLYFLYGLPEFITAVYIVGYYLKQVRPLSGIEKRQVQYYVVGGILMLIPVMVFDFVLPLLFKNTSYYKFGTIGNAVWTMIVGYSILTTRFLDTRVVLGSVIGVLMKTIFISVFLFVILFILEPIWGITFSLSGVLKIVIISLFLSFLLVNIFKTVENFLAERFVYVRYHPTKDLRTLISKNLETVDFRLIVQNLLDLINKSFKPGFVSVILFDSNGELLIDESRGKKIIETKNIRETLAVWRKLNSNRILIFSELKNYKRVGKSVIDLKRGAILSFMEENSIEVIFSLKEEGKFDGVVLIGQNYDRNAYTVGDIDFLDNVIQNTHMSLVRSFLYLELQNFNKTLQQKVNEQTKELQEKVSLLQEARRKERDMIDIMGHELRTPATIVKLNVELLEKFIDSNPQDFKKYIDRAKGAIDNEIKLINTLLSSAKLEGDKIEINKERVNIKEEIQMSIHGNETDALSKGIELKSNVDTGVPDVYADKARTVEVLNNLISNGIKYTEQGSVTIVTEYDDKYVKIIVEDTGKGISEEEIPKLGHKFHRIGNYIQSSENREIVRPGGTGLGLYVSFNLVALMGGKMWVESELGKGSKFIFTLPVFKDQIESDSNNTSNNMFERLGLKK